MQLVLVASSYQVKIKNYFIYFCLTSLITENTTVTIDTYTIVGPANKLKLSETLPTMIMS